MTPQTKGAKLRAWIGDVRSVMGLKKKAVDPAAAERKEMLAALSQLRKEKEFSTRAINGEAFLKKYAKYKQEAAEVEDIVAVAQKEWGQHEAKTAYMYQMEKKADDH